MLDGNGGPMRVLLVDDDVRFTRALTGALRRHGHEVEHAPTAAAGLAAPRCDLILLDLSLPDQDGIEVCGQLRTVTDCGIIMLTARADERDRVDGLRRGADDYVVKPFGFAELLARMEAVMRRTRPPASGVRTVGGLRVDLDGHRADIEAEPVTLTRTEFELLALLVRHPGQTVRRDRLVTDIWRTTWQGTSRALDVHIGNLRAKVRAGADVQTVRGVGFRIVPTASAAPGTERN